jgi:hypothetical protein
MSRLAFGGCPRSGPETSKHMNEIGSRRSRLCIVALTLLFALGCLLHFRRGSYSVFGVSGHRWGSEDAYISFRYGWNLAHFGVLAWNESGYRRTEGFSNPLWVYLSAVWALFKSNRPQYGH